MRFVSNCLRPVASGYLVSASADGLDSHACTLRLLQRRCRVLLNHPPNYRWRLEPLKPVNGEARLSQSAKTYRGVRD